MSRTLKASVLYLEFLSCSRLAQTVCSLLRMGTMGGAPMMPGGGPDPAKVYKTEQDASTCFSNSKHTIDFDPTYAFFLFSFVCIMLEGRELHGV